MSAACGSCKQPVWWTRTAAGALMPVDPPQTAPEGATVAVLRAANGDLHSRVLGEGQAPREGERLTTSHFATCPQADEHRKPRRPR